MGVEQAHRLKELQHEGRRLKKPAACPSLDNSILKEAARGTSKPVPETQDRDRCLPDACGL
jgi:hypothetical protein